MTLTTNTPQAKANADAIASTLIEQSRVLASKANGVAVEDVTDEQEARAFDVMVGRLLSGAEGEEAREITEAVVLHLLTDGA